MHVAYAHDEYLQVLDEAGIVGGVILLLGLGAVVVSLRRVRRHIDSPVAFACVGALVALAVHSSMDFLWHIPLIPIVGTALVALLFPLARTTRDDVASEGDNT
jgi:O-antigen ligase